MNRLTRLLQTPAVALEIFEHPAHTEHRDPDHEVATGFCINFVENGSFRVRPDADRRAAWHVTPETLFVTTPGMAYSCRHDETHPTDRCISIAYTDATIDHLLTVGAGSTTKIASASAQAFESDRSEVGAYAGAWPLTNRYQYLRRKLDACAPGDEMRFDALAADLFFAIGRNETQPLFRADLLSWYTARVDRARSLMDAHFHEPLSLTRLSRDVGMSPFHFARVFRELAGVPPHRYLTTVRLTHAARRLREGASVTDTCLAVGFGSLSHFVTAFRRRYGASPSNWMKTTRRSAAIAR